MRRVCALALLAGVLAISMGCGSGSKSSKPVAPAPTPTSAPKITVERADAAAHDALLVAADMPAAFVVNPSEDDPSLSPEEEAAFNKRFEDCSGTTLNAQGDVDFPGHLAEAKGTEFKDAQDETVSSDADVFQTGEDASAALSTVMRALKDCNALVVEYVDRLFKADPKTADVEINTSFEEYDPGPYGDEHGGFRLNFSIPALHVQFRAETVYVRVGRLGGTYSYFSVNDAGLYKRELASLFEKRLRTVEASLASE